MRHSPLLSSPLASQRSDSASPTPRERPGARKQQRGHSGGTTRDASSAGPDTGSQLAFAAPPIASSFGCSFDAFLWFAALPVTYIIRSQNYSTADAVDTTRNPSVRAQKAKVGRQRTAHAGSGISATRCHRFVGTNVSCLPPRPQVAPRAALSTGSGSAEARGRRSQSGVCSAQVRLHARVVVAERRRGACGAARERDQRACRPGGDATTRRRGENLQGRSCCTGGEGISLLLTDLISSHLIFSGQRQKQHQAHSLTCLRRSFHRADSLCPAPLTLTHRCNMSSPPRDGFKPTVISALLHVASGKFVWSGKGADDDALRLESAVDPSNPSASTFSLDSAPADSADMPSPRAMLVLRDSMNHYVTAGTDDQLRLTHDYAPDCDWRLVDDHYLQSSATDSFLSCDAFGVSMSRVRSDATCRFMLCPAPLEGWLQKKASSGFRAFQKRYFRFAGGQLTYWHQEADAKAGSKATPAGSFPWASITSVSQSKASPLRFDIDLTSTDPSTGHTSKRKLELQASSTVEVAMWVDALKGPHVESIIKAGRLSVVSRQRAGSMGGGEWMPPLPPSEDSSASAPAPPQPLSPTSAIALGVTESPLVAAQRAAELQEADRRRKNSIGAEQSAASSTRKDSAAAAKALEQEQALQDSIHPKHHQLTPHESGRAVDAADSASLETAEREARAAVVQRHQSSVAADISRDVELMLAADEEQAERARKAGAEAVAASKDDASEPKSPEARQAAQESQEAALKRHQQEESDRASTAQRDASVSAAIAAEQTAHDQQESKRIQAQLEQLEAAKSEQARKAHEHETARREAEEAAAKKLAAERQAEIDRIREEAEKEEALRAALEEEELQAKHRAAEAELDRAAQAAKDDAVAAQVEAERAAAVRAHMAATEEAARVAAAEQKERDDAAEAEAKRQREVLEQQEQEKQKKAEQAEREKQLTAQAAAHAAAATAAETERRRLLAEQEKADAARSADPPSQALEASEVEVDAGSPAPATKASSPRLLPAAGGAAAPLDSSECDEPSANRDNAAAVEHKAESKAASPVAADAAADASGDQDGSDLKPHEEKKKGCCVVQ